MYLNSSLGKIRLLSLIMTLSVTWSVGYIQAQIRPSVSGIHGETVGPVSVWNSPVIPETDPRFATRKVLPVTYKEFGKKLHTTALRDLVVDYKKDADFYSRDLSGDYKKNLEVYTRVYDFGDVVWPHWKFVYSENFKDIIDEIARRDLYIFDIWGYIPTADPANLAFGEFKAPIDKHQYMLDKLGPRFLSWSFGEQDGRFVGRYARRICPSPYTRKQAHEYFMAFTRRISNDMHNYLTALSGEPMLHYFADMDGFRMLGAETGQALPSVNMWYTFIRGAGKQYGMQWFGNPSIYNRWATKDYNSPEGRNTHRGTSLSLLKRLWYVETMYNCSLIGFCQGQLAQSVSHTIEIDDRKVEVRNLSSLGELNLEAIKWCKRHPERGVMYTPVALIWDFYTGWLPARSLYAAYPYLVWGNMPYEKGDHQIDMLFRSFFPGYEDCSYYYDEHGYLTATPCGDIFDVLLSNVPRFVLNRYNAALVIGPTKLKGDLLQTIKDFISRGGSVATTASQLTPESAQLFGVELTGKTFKESYSMFPNEIEGFNEPIFTRHDLKLLEGSRVLVTTGTGEPLVVKRKTEAGGELLLFAADYGLSDWITQPTRAGTNQPLVSPYLLPRHVRAILLPWLKRWNIIDVAGEPIQYITNVTKDPNRILLTLCNNEPEQWQGPVRFRHANIAAGTNWMTDEVIKPGESIWVDVGGHELVVLELKADRPVVKFKLPDTRDLLPREYRLNSAEVLERVKASAPETALSIDKPSPLTPAQSKEPPGALYVNEWLFEDKEPNEWVPKIKKMGLEGIEISATRLFSPDMPKLWAALSNVGLRVGAVNAAVDLTPYIVGGLSTKVERRRETSLAWLERILEIMAVAGIDRLVVYPGTLDEQEQSIQEYKNTMAQSLRKLGSKAEDLSIKVVVENVPLVCGSRDLLDFIVASDSPAVKLSFDTAHALIANEDLLETFTTLSKRGLDYVHLSNCRQLPTGLVLDQHLPLTEGEISLDIYHEIITLRIRAGKASCIHMVTPGDPIKTLCETLARIRK